MYLSVLDECIEGGCPALVGFPELCTKRVPCPLRDACLLNNEDDVVIEDEDLPF